MSEELVQNISEKPIHCYGIIAMIDALGTRGFTIDQCVDFFNVRQELIEKSLFRWEVASNHSSVTQNSSKVKVYIQSFADTLVLAVELKEFGSVHGNLTFPTGKPDIDDLFYGMWLERLGYVLGDLIRDAFYKKVIFRGAMSAGEFIIHEKSNSVLGPTVVDVAKFYEKFESFGIVLTPKSSKIIDNLAKSRKPWPSLKKTKILFKLDDCNYNDEKEVYVVNWPNAFCKEIYSEEVIDKVKHDFSSIISEIEIPKKAEKKYETARLFFYSMIEEGLKNNKSPNR